METVVKQLAEGMLAHGYKVSVLCCGETNSIDVVEGVTVYRRKPLLRVGSAPISLRYFFDLHKIIREQDIAHFHVPNPIGELAYYFLRRKRSWKTICTYHLDPVRPKLFVRFYKKLLCRFLDMCDVICPTSPNYVNSSDILRNFREKCHSIALGVDTAKFMNIDEEKREKAESLVKNLKHPRVLFCGRFSYYKGLSFLIEAVNKLPECSLILVGDGEKKEELECQIKALNIQDRVKMLGHLPDELYPAIYHVADLFALPSIYRSEAFGIVGLEAMAAGLPLITTELGGGTSYYNVDEETGYVIAPGDSEILAQAIHKIFAMPEKAKAMSVASKRRVQDFSLVNMIEKYLKCYE
jgi:rhamnosyl/mannosyltransferase